MAQTHWKKLQNPDYLGAYSLDPGKTLIVTIKLLKKEVVTGPDAALKIPVPPRVAKYLAEAPSVYVPLIAKAFSAATV